ncbi:MAG TPA: twin-arginine translocase subunit TatC [Patescibacteria group bacterium]|nr:twin-arginine translocase subunit TatC [Patescibacteria group bacterium]
MRAKKPKKNRDQSRLSKTEHNPRIPFVEHLIELRKRVFYVALSILLWGAAAYFVQQQLVALLLKPAHNQQFIYTSVGGGIDFLFRISLYAGIALSIPVIVFHILKYLQPLIKKDAVRFIAWGSVVSGILAIAGMAFGYFIGLPAALHFLLHQFSTSQIHPLLTIQSYMSFVTMYMLGSALLFQLPLLLVLINRIKPLKPKKLLGLERWVILIAFIGGGVMNPSPRVQDQLLLAGPMIIAYQVGVIIVWLANRGDKRTDWVNELIRKDSELQTLRRTRFQQAQVALQQQMRAHQQKPTQHISKPVAVTAQMPTNLSVTPAAIAQGAGRSRSYLNDFSTRRSAISRYPRLSQDSAESSS